MVYFSPKSTEGEKVGGILDECSHCMAGDPEVQTPAGTLPFCQDVAMWELKPHVSRLLLLPRYQRALLSVKFHRCGHYTTPTFGFLYWILVKGNNVFENNISIFRIWRLHKTGVRWNKTQKWELLPPPSSWIFLDDAFLGQVAWWLQWRECLRRELKPSWKDKELSSLGAHHPPPSARCFFSSAKLAPHNFLHYRKDYVIKTPPFIGSSVTSFLNRAWGQSYRLWVAVRMLLSTWLGCREHPYCPPPSLGSHGGGVGAASPVLDEAVKQQWFVFDVRPVLWPSLGPFQCQQLSRACLLLK